MQVTIPVVDLFAGPGGLGEGFASFRASERRRATFKILVSIEKDPWAHQTLELRSFFRQFAYRPAPPEYYRYLRGEITRTELFAAWPLEARAAKREARRSELGTSDDAKIYRWIDEALRRRTARDWVLLGGPPCQAYSVAGRARMRSADPEQFEKDPRHFLYKEYLQIIARFRPSVFVMENVKGLLSATVEKESIFQKILSDLKNPTDAIHNETVPCVDEHCPCRAGTALPRYRIYSLVIQRDDPEHLRPSDFVIRSEDYGIPQTRHRVILLGVRDDLESVPRTLTRYPVPVAACQVLSDLPPLRSYLSKQADEEGKWRAAVQSVLTRKWFTELGNEKQDLFTQELRATIETNARQLPTGLTTGKEFLQGLSWCVYRPDWYHDAQLNGICNHTTRAHMEEDLHRYLFLSCYARVYGSSPTIGKLPAELLPNHRNLQEVGEQRQEEDIFDDRFRVQVAGKPATTITSHIHKDGHYNIHYAPEQCRSLTVREAARLQTFPDNYFFEGSRTQQYRQVGNAVPPLLAEQIASVVHDLFEQVTAVRRRQEAEQGTAPTPLVQDTGLTPGP